MVQWLGLGASTAGSLGLISGQGPGISQALQHSQKRNYNPQTNKTLNKQNSWTRWLHRKILSNIRKEVTPTLLNFFKKKKKCRGRNTLKLILWGHHHPDTKTKDTTHKKRKLQAISLMNIDTKISNKILAHWIQYYIKSIIHHDQVGFIPERQEFFNICKLITVINTLKNWRIKTIWSSQEMWRKLLTKFNNHLWFKKKKTLEIWYRENKPQYNKKHIWQTQANIILNGENLKSFPLKSGTRQGCLYSCHFYLTWFGIS